MARPMTVSDPGEHLLRPSRVYLLRAEHRVRPHVEQRSSSEVGTLPRAMGGGRRNQVREQACVHSGRLVVRRPVRYVRLPTMRGVGRTLLTHNAAPSHPSCEAQQVFPDHHHLLSSQRGVAQVSRCDTHHRPLSFSIRHPPRTAEAHWRRTRRVCLRRDFPSGHPGTRISSSGTGRFPRARPRRRDRGGHKEGRR